MNRFFIFRLIGGILALLATVPHSEAASWLVPAGDWNTPANWSGSMVPNSATQAIIDNGGQASLAKKSVKASGLYVGFLTPVTGTSTPPVPGAGTGVVTFLGGSLSVNSTVLGNALSTHGEISVTRGNLTNTNDLIIGRSGTGVLGVSGGNVTNSTGYLGMSAGSLGTAEITGGLWKNLNGLVVGASGTGVLSIGDKGTVSITGGNKVLGLATGGGSSGTLNFGLGNQVGALNVTAVDGGGGTAVVNFNHTGAATFAPNLTGSLTVNKLGIGTTILTGTNSYTGVTTISSGTLQVGNGSTKGTLGTGAVINNGGLAFHRSGTLTVANAISGTGSVQQFGSGVTILSGSNTYAGPTSVTKGALQIDANGRLGLGELTINGGGIRFGAAFDDLRSFTTGPAGAVLDTNGFDVIFAGAAGGSGSLTKTGAGRLILTGSNSYAGSTTISAGSLQVGDGVTNSSLGHGKITNNGALIYRLAGDAQINNIISGKGQLVKSGADRVTLTGVNSYSGGTLVHQGVLQLGNAKALGTAQGALSLEGGTLDLYGYNVTIGALSGSSGLITTTFPSVAVTLTTNSTASGHYAGTISDGSGTVALVKLGSGVLALSGSNSYSGGTTLSGGGVDVNHAHAFGTGLITITGAVALDNTSGAEVELSSNNLQNWKANFSFKGSRNLNLGTGAVSMHGSRVLTVASSTLTVGGIISGGAASHGLTKSGTGTLLLTGNNTYTGATVVNAGTLQVGQGGTTGSLASAKAAVKGQLAFNRSDDISFDGTISGGGSVRQAGTGRLTLNGANSYTGGTVLSAGKLQVGHSKALGKGALDIQAAELDLNGFSIGVTSLSGQGGAVITTTSAAASVLTTTTTGSTVFSGMIGDGAGSVGLALSGKGVLALEGYNTYSGGTTLTSGELHLGSADAIGTGTLTVSKGVLDNVTGSALTLATNNAQRWNGDLTFKGSNSLDFGTGSVVMKGTRTVTVTASTLTIGGGIGGLASGDGLKKAGAGTLILDGDNTYEGATTISQGTFQIGRGATPTTFASRAIVNQGALIFNASNDLYYRGTISGKGSLQHTGGGLLFLSGVNTYSGGTVIDEGILRLGNLKALGSPSGSLAISMDGALEINGGPVGIGTLSGAGTLSNFGNVAGTLTTTSAVTSTFSGQISDASASDPAAAALEVVKAGNGTLILTGSNTYSGGTKIAGGTLQLGAGSGTGTIAGDVGNDGVLIFNHNVNLNFDGLISGKGSVRQVGMGNLLTLTANNTYTGGTAIGAGAGLRLVDGGAIGSGTVENNGALLLAYAGPLSLANTINGSGRLQQEGAGQLTLLGANNYSGGTIINSGKIQLGHAKALGSTSGDLAVNNGSLDLNGFSLTVRSLSGSGAGASIINTAAKDVTLTTALNGSGTFAGTIENGVSARTALVKSGTGTLVLTGNNSYTGGTTINSGTLQIGAGGSTGSLTGPITNKGALVFARSDTFTFGHPVTGTGLVVQAGPGTLILTGSNSHTGGTRLLAGTLEVGNAAALGLGSLTLTGGTLATNGIEPTIRVKGNLVWNSSAIIELTLTDNAFSERLIVDGQIVLEGNSSLVFSLNPAGLTGANSFLLMSVAGGFNGLTPANFNFASTDPGLAGTFRITGNNLWFDQTAPFLLGGAAARTMSIQAVPEPSTCLLTALAGGALLAGHLRRRRTSRPQ